MIPEIGNFSLMLAFALALLQGTLPIAGTFTGRGRWIAMARPLATGQATFVTIAFACLVYCFATNDFSVTYVATNSNSMLPWYYRLAATWGGHEGSLLLWGEMLALWTFAVAQLSSQLPEQTVARVLGVMGLISIGFLSFMLFTSDPFERLLPAAADGRDLNPLLQDFGMIVHPPMLYMGYVGFSVAFAFAIAALMGGQLDAAWARWSRPWTLVAWVFLTLGIFMGSFWAYYELGWGGWWFWDAVENASFMPWLVGTALVHSLAVTEKRGSFKNWTVLLAIVAFSLALLGTFLVRSGVLTSVHAFAADPRRGLFILAFLAVVVGGSLLLYAWRAPGVGLGGRFSLFSRESILLVNNVMLLAAMTTVFLGTLYPMFLDALDLGKISVGPPYFEAVFVPLMLPVLVLIGIGPYVHWKNARIGTVLRRLRWIGAVAVLVGLCTLVAVTHSVLSALGVGLSTWILLSCALHVGERLGHGAAGETLVQRIRRQPRNYWGMIVAHAGIAVFVAGVTMVKSAEVSTDVTMQVGDSATVAGYTFRFASLRDLQGPNFVAAQATFIVTRDQSPVTVMRPEKRLFTVQQMPMTEAAIDRGLMRDLYVSLGDELATNQWVVRIQHKPMVCWIWAGALIIALGGLLAASDRRYRLYARKSSATMATDGRSEQPVTAN